MDNYKLIRNKTTASDIWRRRDYYKLYNFSLSDICRIYNEHHPNSSILSRRNHYQSFVLYFRDVPVKNINTSDLMEWMVDTQKKYNLSERTLLQIKSQLNPLFKWLLMEGIISSNPMTNIKFRRNVAPKRSRCVMGCQEVAKILEDAKAHDPVFLFPYLYTVAHTGARRSEVANLKWTDFDNESGHLVFRETKNGSDRKIMITANLKILLSSMEKKNEFIFNNKRNEKLNRSAIERMMNEFKSKSCLAKDWHLHDLRHSFAHNFLLKGGEMYQLQAILGHKSIQMTVDLYGNLKSHHIKNPSPYDF